MAFPRIRGGDPVQDYQQICDAELFPAYAGVIPYSTPPERSMDAFPRIRGGDPCSYRLLPDAIAFSPHTRG